MLEDVFIKALGLLSGGQRNEEALRIACEAAVCELGARLKETVTKEGLGERFISAAAVLALSVYTQLDERSSVSSFKAGDVSVSRRGADSTRSAANALRYQAENMLAGAIRDRSFDFRGVLG